MCFIISTCFVGNHLTWVVFIFFVSRDILFGAENGACMHCGDIKTKKTGRIGYLNLLLFMHDV